MSLHDQLVFHPDTGSWPQNMTDNWEFLPYDTCAPPHQMQQSRSMASQYVLALPYGRQPAPPIFTTPQYQVPAAWNMAYDSPSPTSPVGSLFRNDYQEQRYILHPEQASAMTGQRDSRSLHDMQFPSPSTRSESLAYVSRAFVSSQLPTAAAKTITYNETIDLADRVNFETYVDKLMKVIQRRKADAKPEASHGSTPAHTPRVDFTESSAANSAAPSENNPKKYPNKKWVCDGPGCNKTFVQKTHLDIHRRTHTGAKPYVCGKDKCGRTFSQRGNLKTHMRRHTGEKPFSCRICGMNFAQRGNMRAHEKAHEGNKPFICKLDGCNKTFSQLGNMKTHQNKFHKKSIQNLTLLFAKLDSEKDVPEAHRELFEYFKEIYKNSNKGVKGRGKTRKVTRSGE